MTGQKQFVVHRGHFPEGYQIRHETFEGREMIVAPVCMMVEGVHRGSAGALFYSADELSRLPEQWNGSPLPVFHPVDREGDHISANSPSVIEARSVGFLFNVGWIDDGLRGEVWVDVEKARLISPRALQMLEAGEPMEVSTGMWFDVDGKPGAWRGEDHLGSVSNIVRDHLALLPDAEGACSLQDGCGIRANIRSSARTPAFHGTESIRWAGVDTSFGAYRDAYYRGHGGRPTNPVARVQDAPGPMKNWIASKTLLGDGASNDEGDLIFFPVVNPETDKLNEGALRAVISGRGSSANIPAATKASAQREARSLLDHHFGTDLAQNEAGQKEGSVKAKVAGLLRAAADAIISNDGDEETSTKEGDQESNGKVLVPEKCACMARFRTNELSGDEKECALQRLVDNLDNENWFHFVVDYYDDRVVYRAIPRTGALDPSASPMAQEAKLYMVGYTVDAQDVVTLNGQPQEVRDKHEYVPVGNEEGTTMEGQNAKPEAGAPAPAGNEGAAAPVTPPTPKFEITASQFAILQRAEAQEIAHKEELKGAIKANEKSTFTDEQLDAMNIDTLEQLAALAQIEPTVDYTGQLGGNAAGEDQVAGPSVWDLGRPLSPSLKEASRS